MLGPSWCHMHDGVAVSDSRRRNGNGRCEERYDTEQHLKVSSLKSRQYCGMLNLDRS